MNSGNNIQFSAYHGTNTANKNSILAQGHISPSCREDEWVGSGIYFFVDEKTDAAAIENARKYALYVHHFHQNDIAVVMADAVIPHDSFLNLDTDQSQEVFQAYRDLIIKAYIKKIREGNASREPFFVDGKKLDCAAINKMCEYCNIKAVKNRAYINFVRNKYRNRDGETLGASRIPNCTILCVRDDSVLYNLREAI
jgi:hypothetical protein